MSGCRPRTDRSNLKGDMVYIAVEPPGASAESQHAHILEIEWRMKNSIRWTATRSGCPPVAQVQEQRRNGLNMCRH